MHWNLFSTFVALVLGAGLIWTLLMIISDWIDQRHEYRMAQLQKPNVTPIRKDIA